MTTPLFLLRCVELGLSIRDLELLTIGLVGDLYTEKLNDTVEPEYLAEQEDMDTF